MSTALSLETFNIVHPDHYAELGYPHEIWTRLRREDPVHLWEKTEGMPFWAVTKHRDIVEVSTQPEKFLSAPRTVVQHLPEQPQLEGFPPTLIQMDGPQHRVFRKLVNKRFKPQAFKQMHPAIERIGKEIVDELVQEDFGECDFVDAVSAPLPIAVIAWMLGLPEEDWPKLYHWTNRIIGSGDPEFREEGKTPQESSRANMVELFTYFTQLLEEKRKHPADDLCTLFTQMEVDGQKLELMDQLAWCLIITIAGNETTRNATTGGMLAFVEHPDELRKLQADPSLLKPAVEEVVRWTSPIIHFARTADCDYELRGKKIEKGQVLALFYPSANRDEEVFEDPFAFRIDRHPNRHVGFGVGEHFCVGAHVARLEIEIAYKHLLPRIEEIELAGPVDRLHSALVGGVKRLPIRYKLRPAA